VKGGAVEGRAEGGGVVGERGKEWVGEKRLGGCGEANREGGREKIGREESRG